MGIGLEQLRRDYRKDNNLDLLWGVLGDDSGNVYVSPGTDDSLVYVRRAQADGFLPASRHYVEGTLQIRYGAPVRLRYNENNELVVHGAYRQGQTKAGFNHATNNPAAPEAIWYSSEKWLQLNCHALPGATMSIGVAPWVYITADGTYTIWPGGTIDLTTSQPGVGEWCVALVYLDTSNALAVSVSTAQTADLDPLDSTDRQEALTATVDMLAPVWFWKLRGDATSIGNSDRLEDARQFIDSFVGGGAANDDALFLAWRGTNS